MGLYERINRVVRANLNDMVSQSAEPEQVLEQCISNMQETLLELRQALIQGLTTQKLTEQQYNKSQSEIKNLQQRAQLALQEGDEILARELLLQKKTHTEAAATLKAQLETEAAKLDTLKRSFVALESKLTEANTKLKAKEQSQNPIEGLGTSSTKGAFERMEEKVAEMERRSQKPIKDLWNDNAEEMFAPEELDTDAELQEMKRQLLQPVPPKAKEFLIIERAIHDTSNAILKLSDNKDKINNQHVRANAEVNNFHKQALDATHKGNPASAIQALLNEAVQRKVTDLLKAQIEEQEAIIYILQQHLVALKEVKMAVKVKQFPNFEQDENDKFLTSNPSVKGVDAELEFLRQQIDNL
ncbi:MAG TPA: PspA/IM30 family protein [Candidatus Obscuribacterales bacterium]